MKPDPNYREPASASVEVVDELPPLRRHTPRLGPCVLCGAGFSSHFACPGSGEIIVNKTKAPSAPGYVLAERCDEQRPHVHVTCAECAGRWICEPKDVADERRRIRRIRLIRLAAFSVLVFLVAWPFVWALLWR